MYEIRLECVTGYPAPHCDECNPCDVARVVREAAKSLRRATKVGDGFKALKESCLAEAERLDSVVTGRAP